MVTNNLGCFSDSARGPYKELADHAAMAITLDTYSHVLPGMSDGLADAMDEALG
jgi:hypothetical protein